jgi:hypothetical protein
MKRPRTAISDHAIVRYLERVEGLDIAALRLKIAQRVDYAASLGASAVIVDGFRYIFAEDAGGTPIVVTVEPQGTFRPIRRSGRNMPE